MYSAPNTWNLHWPKGNKPTYKVNYTSWILSFWLYHITFKIIHLYICGYFYHSFYLSYYCNIRYVVLSFDEIKTHYSLLLLLFLIFFTAHLEKLFDSSWFSYCHYNLVRMNMFQCLGGNVIGTKKGKQQNHYKTHARYGCHWSAL